MSSCYYEDMKKKTVPTRRFPRRKPQPYVPAPLAHTNYYEEKTLEDVCGGLSLRLPSVFDDMKDDPSALKRAHARAEFERANNARSPRDLPDDWKQEMDRKKFGL